VFARPVSPATMGAGLGPAGGNHMARRRHSGGGRREYPRTARVNELVREIIAEELERIDDPRLEMVSVTGVEVEQELTQGVVFFSSLTGEEADAEVLGALAEHRSRLQAAIGRQSRMRRTPALRFRPDAGVRGGARIEELLRAVEPIIAAPDVAALAESRPSPYRERPTPGEDDQDVPELGDERDEGDGPGPG